MFGPRPIFFLARARGSAEGSIVGREFKGAAEGKVNMVGNARGGASGKARRAQPGPVVLSAGLMIAGLLVSGSQGCQPGSPIEAVGRSSQPGEGPLATAPSGRPYSEKRDACANRDPLRKAFWGELHVHSELSFDANMWDVRGSAPAVL